jgi:hypothetical protein
MSSLAPLELQELLTSVIAGSVWFGDLMGNARRSKSANCAKSNGDPGAIRTHDPQLRRLVLYPAELPGHSGGLWIVVLPGLRTPGGIAGWRSDDFWPHGERHGGA